MMVGLFGLGLCFLFVSMLLTQCMRDSYTIYFVYICSEFLLYPVFRTTNMSIIGSSSSSKDKYYYFGYNEQVPSIHNFWIAYLIAIVAAVIYFLIELWRHSLSFRMSLKMCSHCGKYCK